MVDKLDLTGVGMTSQRTRMRLVERLREQGIDDEDVLDIVSSTPRHIFVDEALSHRAYEDTALPIGFNQTISQPYVNARMCAALSEDGPLVKVLEVGTGSGYQTSILAQMSEKVFTVERIRGLQERARDRLNLLGLRNIHYRHSDGGMGWPEQGPFDGIIVSASPRKIPKELLDQLAIRGRMVIPVGDEEEQELQLITLTPDGMKVTVLERVRFVPMLTGRIR
jgi:protein-L-isoaspartate(D-aspartate) O-methyltransferase